MEAMADGKAVGWGSGAGLGEYACMVWMGVAHRGSQWQHRYTASTLLTAAVPVLAVAAIDGDHNFRLRLEQYAHCVPYVHGSGEVDRCFGSRFREGIATAGPCAALVMKT